MVSSVAMIGMSCMVLAFGASLVLLRRLGAQDVALSLLCVAIAAVVFAFAGTLLR